MDMCRYIIIEPVCFRIRGLIKMKYSLILILKQFLLNESVCLEKSLDKNKKHILGQFIRSFGQSSGSTTVLQSSYDWQTIWF